MWNNITFLEILLRRIPNKCFDWHSEFISSFRGRKIAMAICDKKTVFDEFRFFNRNEEFFFGDFPNVENRINSDSLDFFVTFLIKKKSKVKSIIITIF